MANEIAVIGVDCRLPGADSPQQYWKNLQTGQESISVFEMHDLRASGLSEDLIRHPSYVPAKGVAPNADVFDSDFFGMSPREAELTDPQHRLLLECAWNTLEAAGYDPGTYGSRIGIYGGCGIPSYLLNCVLPHLTRLGRMASGLPLLISSDKDHLTSKISYRLNLRGPSVTVQTACSTSLVAVHIACQALLSGDCEMALAGGANVTAPLKSGYLYEPGGILSPDGHCRPFDRQAAGTVFGDGVGLVLLKKLDDARRDKDHIHAVIVGSAINNDGSRKIGYSAPSVQGQRDVILAALDRVQNTNGRYDVDYIECHGTATPLGDPIEISALNEVFERTFQDGAECAIGSVKGNIGHLDAAAGIAGFIKTVLSIENGEIPPSLHFQAWNPEIAPRVARLYVNTKLSLWPERNRLRRASISSFGIGGTNAHVILEQAPRPVLAPPRGPTLMIISARSESALLKRREQLAAHLEDHPHVRIEDVAYTLQVGRRSFAYRQYFTSGTLPDAIEALRSGGASSIVKVEESRPIAFIFPSINNWCLHAGSAPEELNPTFCQALGRCAELIRAEAGWDLRHMVYPPASTQDEATRKLREIEFAQPITFAVQYSLAKLWIEAGIQPSIMLGHGIGEYVAACLAGVIRLEDAIKFVLQSARLMQGQPRGAMLQAAVDVASAGWYLEPGISLAAVDDIGICVFAGRQEDMEVLRNRLSESGIPSRWLPICRALHSPAMGGVSDACVELLQGIELRAPSMSIISSMTGHLITPEEATSPHYWGAQCCTTVRYHEALLATTHASEILLEMGPNKTPTKAVNDRTGCISHHLFSLGSTPENDRVQVLAVAGKLWSLGTSIKWQASELVLGDRTPLPGYPFSQIRHWINGTPDSQATNEDSASRAEKRFTPAESSQIHQPEARTKQNIATRLRAIAQDLTGLPDDEISDTANFGELGVDSLLMLKVMQIIKVEFGISVPAAFMLDGATTLTTLASFLSDSILRDPNEMDDRASQITLAT